MIQANSACTRRRMKPASEIEGERGVGSLHRDYPLEKERATTPWRNITRQHKFAPSPSDILPPLERFQSAHENHWFHYQPLHP